MEERRRTPSISKANAKSVGFVKMDRTSVGGGTVELSWRNCRVVT